MASLLLPALKVTAKMAGGSKGSGLSRAATRSTRSTGASTIRAAKPSSHSSGSTHHSTSSTKPSGSSHHNDSGPSRSSRDPRSSEPSRDSRQQDPRRSSVSRSSNNSRPDYSREGNGQRPPQANTQQPPSSGRSQYPGQSNGQRLPSKGDGQRLPPLQTGPCPPQGYGQYPAPSNSQYPPQGSNQRFAQGQGQQLPSQPQRRQGGDRPLSPPPTRRAGGEGARRRPPSPLSPTYPRRRGDGGRGGGGRSPPPNDAPRRRSWREKMPTGAQFQNGMRNVQDTVRTVQDITYAGKDLYQTAQSFRGRGNQGMGPSQGRFDDEGGFPPSPGGGGGGMNDDIYPQDGGGGGYPPRDDGGDGNFTPRDDGGGGDFTPRDDGGGGDFTPRDDGDFTPTPLDSGPRRNGRKAFDQWPDNSRPPTTQNGRGGSGGRNVDYASSPDGGDYTPSDDDFTPSPVDGRGKKRFDQWPTTKAFDPSAPASGRSLNPGQAGNRGPSPLGPGGSNQNTPKPQPNPEKDEFVFEKCQHSMRYVEGPWTVDSNGVAVRAGPYDYRAKPAPWMKQTTIAFAGYCLSCDTKDRRKKENDFLEAYEKSYNGALNAFRAQNKREPSPDEHRQIRTFHQGKKSNNIKEVWNKWNERWKSPVLVAYGDDGKAVLERKAARN